MSDHWAKDQESISFKTQQGPFHEIWKGTKKADLRNLKDREIWPQQGDVVIFYEYWDGTKQYSGRFVTARITHVQTGYCLPKNVVSMSLEVLARGGIILQENKKKGE